MSLNTWTNTEAQHRYEGRIRCLVLGLLPWECLSDADLDQHLWDTSPETLDHCTQVAIDNADADMPEEYSAYDYYCYFDNAYTNGDKLGMQYWLKKLAKLDREMCEALLSEYRAWAPGRKASYYGK